MVWGGVPQRTRGNFLEIHGLQVIQMGWYSAARVGSTVSCGARSTSTRYYDVFFFFRLPKIPGKRANDVKTISSWSGSMIAGWPTGRVELRSLFLVTACIERDQNGTVYSRYGMVLVVADRRFVEHKAKEPQQGGCYDCCDIPPFSLPILSY